MTSIEKTELRDITSPEASGMMQKVKSTVYYSQLDSTLSTAEELVRHCTVHYSMPNPSFGTTSEVSLTTKDNILNVYLHLVVPTFNPQLTVADNNKVALMQAWGLRAIKQVRIQIGASNETIVLDRPALMALYITQCEGQEKLDHLLDMAGKIAIWNDADTSYGGWKNYDQHAYIQLPMPWSTLRTSLCKNKGLPADLLNQPVNISIEWAPFQDFCNVSGVNVTTTAFKRAELSLRTSTFTDQGYSLRETLFRNPTASYKIPFVSTRTGSSAYFTSTPVSATNLKSAVPFRMSLQGMENGDLQTVYIIVNRIKDLKSPAVNNQASRPLEFVSLEDVELEYNGVTIYRSPDRMHHLLSQITSNKSGGNYLSSAGLTRAADVHALTNTFTNHYIVAIDMTRCSSAHLTEFQNTIKYNNGSLNLSFNTINNGNADEEMFVQVLYQYLSVISINGSGTSQVLLV